MKYILLAFIFLSDPSFAQINKMIRTEAPDPKKDSLLKTELTQFLNHILSLSCDRKAKPDTAAVYRVVYKMVCPFRGFRNEADYADSLHLFCTQNIRRSQDSMKLDFFDLKRVERKITKLRRSNGPRVVFTNFKKRKVLPHSAAYVSIASFNKGEYLILSENYLAPDIRSDLPLGHDHTYLIRRIR